MADAEPAPTPATTLPGELLLAVQELDLAADALRRRRGGLVERAAVAAVEAEAAELERRSRDLVAAAEERSAHEARLAADAGELAQRIALIENRSRSGAVNYREQGALAAELAALARHRDELEDEELGELTELDRLQSETERLEAERPVLVDRHRRALAALAAAERALDEGLAELAARRHPLAAALEPRLSGEYEQLRAHLGGEAVARVVRGACSGCHLALPATEADRLRHAPAGTLARCEQCGRILVT